MSEVATAWVSLVPSAKGFAKRTEAELSGEVTRAGRASGKKMGGGMAATLGKTLRVGAAGAALGAGALVGAALWKGMDRLRAIDDAKGKLTGLGHSAKGVEKIMDNALASVKGTAFGLDEASSVAASAVAAGIKPGKALTQNLKLVADAATIAGTDMGSMGAIFNKVAASNKVQMDTINQLHDAGVPALSLLAKQMGVTAEEASKMASKGEIDFATFQKAMDKGLGGAALESGKTMSGSYKNMQAALSRLGASVLSGVFPKIAPMLTKITGWLDQAGPHAERFGASLGTAFAWVGTNLPKAWAAVKGFFSSFSASGEGAQASALFNDLKLTMQAWWAYGQAMFTAARTVVMAFWRAFGPTVLAYIRPTFANLITVVRGGLQIVRGIFQTVSALLKGDWRGAWNGIKTILSGAWKVIQGVVRQGGNVLRTVMSAIGIALRGIATAIWSGIKAAFVAGVNASVNAVRGLQARAVGALRGAGTWLVGVGMDIMAGLGAGIDRGIAWVTAKLNALKDKITGPIRKVLGIASPSRVMARDVGRWIPAGIAKGIDAGAPAVTASMNSLATGVISPVTPGLGSPHLGEPLGATASPARGSGRPRDLEDTIRRALEGIQMRDQSGRRFSLTLMGA